MTDDDWPLSLDQCAARFLTSPQTLRRRLREIRALMPDVIPYTPNGRAKIFFEDDFERLRECLRALDQSKIAGGFGAIRLGHELGPSAILLPEERYERALALCRERMKKPRRPRSSAGDTGKKVVALTKGRKRGRPPK